MTGTWLSPRRARGRAERAAERAAERQGERGAARRSGRQGERGAGAAATARAFFPAVEGMRAVAALLVVLVHVGFVSGVSTSPGAAGAYTARGEVGVGVFFLISGFLLYRPYALAHLAGAAVPATVPYLVRRALRILPLYWTALAVVLLLVPAARPQDPLDALLLVGLAQVYREQTVFLGVPQAWSLCVELVFYLALPAYAALLARRRRSPQAQLRAEVVGCVVLIASALTFRALFTATGVLPFPVWHGFLLVWTDLFALGFLLAVLSAWRSGRGPLLGGGAATACWVAAAGTYAVLSTAVGLGREPIYHRSTGQALAEQALWGLFALLLLVPAVAGPARGPVWRLLTGRVLAFVGLVSYGVYLWHQLVVEQLLEHTSWDLFRAPFAVLLAAVVVATVALSALSYALVERPGVAVGHRWVRRRREQLAVHHQAG